MRCEPGGSGPVTNRTNETFRPKETAKVDTALVYSVGIALLAVAAAGGFLFEGNARTRAPRAVAPPPELPPGPCTVPPYTQATPHEAEPTKTSEGS